MSAFGTNSFGTFSTKFLNIWLPWSWQFFAMNLEVMTHDHDFFLSNLKMTNTILQQYSTAKFETLFIIMCCILSRTISCVSSYVSAPIAWTSFFHPQGNNRIKACTCKENIETFLRKYNVTSNIGSVDLLLHFTKVKCDSLTYFFCVVLFNQGIPAKGVKPAWATSTTQKN